MKRLLLALLLALPVQAEVVDSVVTDAAGEMLLRINDNAGEFQSNDTYTVCAFFESDGIGDIDYPFALARDNTAADYLVGFRVNITTGTLNLRSTGGAGTSDTSAAAVVINTWYSWCLSNDGAGNVTLSWYAENGTLIEDMLIADGENFSSGATDLAFSFNAWYDGSDATIDNPLEGESALHACWLTDIGDTGRDAYAANPLNYTGTTNIPDCFKLYDNEGDITGTVNDHSAAARTFTLNGTATVSANGGPTVTDFVAGPTFSSGPTFTPTTNGYTVSGTLQNANGTVYAAALNPGASTPADCDALQALSATAPIFASEAWVSTVANNFPLTLSGAWPRYDVHACADDGTNPPTVVTSSLNLNRSEDAIQDITILSSSISATSIWALQTVTGCDTTDTSTLVTGCGAAAWLQEGMEVDLSAAFADLSNVKVECVNASNAACGAGEIRFEAAKPANATTSNITITQDAYFSPTVATGDAVEGRITFSTGGIATVGTDGEIQCTEAVPGDGLCAGYMTWIYNIQDVSDATDGDFDSGPPQWTVGDDTLHIGSTRPEIDPAILGVEVFERPLLLYVGVALSDCQVGASDVDEQTVTVTSRTAFPTGVTLAADGECTGTPSVEDEAGTSVIIDAVDSGGLWATPLAATFYVTDDEIVAPNCVGDVVGDEESGCIGDLMSVRSWESSEDQLTATFGCSSSVASGDIISQIPAAAGTLAAEDDPLLVVVSTGPCALLNRRRR